MFAIVHDLADWRVILRHHDQIHAHSLRSGLSFCVGHNTNLLALFIDQPDTLRRNLIVSQRLFTVAFALDTASLPSRFFWRKLLSGLLRTIWHIPPIQTGARVYWPRKGFTSEKTGKKWRYFARLSRLMVDSATHAARRDNGDIQLSLGPEPLRAGPLQAQCRKYT